MSSALKRTTLEEYFERELHSPVKHEYFDGEVFAMTGATIPHNQIVMSASSSLYVALEDTGCQVFPSDLRIMLPTGLFTYPDISVVCGKIEYETWGGLETVTNPLLIVEVLSKSTEVYDRGAKFAHYRTLPSLRGYLLLSQDRPRAEHFARQSDGGWLLSEVNDLESEIALPELNLSLPLARLYRQVIFPAVESPELPQPDQTRTADPGEPKQP